MLCGTSGWLHGEHLLFDGAASTVFATLANANVTATGYFTAFMKVQTFHRVQTHLHMTFYNLFKLKVSLRKTPPKILSLRETCDFRSTRGKRKHCGSFLMRPLQSFKSSHACEAPSGC